MKFKDYINEGEVVNRENLTKKIFKEHQTETDKDTKEVLMAVIKGIESMKKTKVSWDDITKMMNSRKSLLKILKKYGNDPIDFKWIMDL